MAKGKKISELGEVQELTGEELIPIVKDGMITPEETAISIHCLEWTHS